METKMDLSKEILNDVVSNINNFGTDNIPAVNNLISMYGAKDLRLARKTGDFSIVSGIIGDEKYVIKWENKVAVIEYFSRFVTYRELMEVADEINFKNDDSIKEVDDLIENYDAFDQRDENNSSNDLICYGETMSNGKIVHYQMLWKNNIAIVEFRPID